MKFYSCKCIIKYIFATAITILLNVVNTKSLSPLSIHNHQLSNNSTINTNDLKSNNDIYNQIRFKSVLSATSESLSHSTNKNKLQSKFKNSITSKEAKAFLKEALPKLKDLKDFDYFVDNKDSEILSYLMKSENKLNTQEKELEQFNALKANANQYYNGNNYNSFNSLYSSLGNKNNNANSAYRSFLNKPKLSDLLKASFDFVTDEDKRWKKGLSCCSNNTKVKRNKTKINICNCTDTTTVVNETDSHCNKTCNGNSTPPGSVPPDNIPIPPLTPVHPKPNPDFPSELHNKVPIIAIPRSRLPNNTVTTYENTPPNGYYYPPDDDIPFKPKLPKIPSEPYEPREPDEPNKPFYPKVPEIPSEPLEPDEPIKPTVPDKPNEPRTPTNPNDPREPLTPNHPNLQNKTIFCTPRDRIKKKKTCNNDEKSLKGDNNTVIIYFNNTPQNSYPNDNNQKPNHPTYIIIPPDINSNKNKAITDNPPSNIIINSPFKDNCTISSNEREFYMSQIAFLRKYYEDQNKNKDKDKSKSNNYEYSSGSMIPSNSMNEEDNYNNFDDEFLPARKVVDKSKKQQLEQQKLKQDEKMKRDDKKQIEQKTNKEYKKDNKYKENVKEKIEKKGRRKEIKENIIHNYNFYNITTPNNNDNSKKNIEDFRYYEKYGNQSMRGAFKTKSVYNEKSEKRIKNANYAKIGFKSGNDNNDNSENNEYNSLKVLLMKLISKNNYTESISKNDSHDSNDTIKTNTDSSNCNKTCNITVAPVCEKCNCTPKTVYINNSTQPRACVCPKPNCSPCNVKCPKIPEFPKYDDSSISNMIIALKASIDSLNVKIEKNNKQYNETINRNDYLNRNCTNTTNGINPQNPINYYIVAKKMLENRTDNIGNSTNFDSNINGSSNNANSFNNSSKEGIDEAKSNQFYILYNINGIGGGNSSSASSNASSNAYNRTSNNSYSSSSSSTSSKAYVRDFSSSSNYQKQNINKIFNNKERSYTNIQKSQNTKQYINNLNSIIDVLKMKKNLMKTIKKNTSHIISGNLTESINHNNPINNSNSNEPTYSDNTTTLVITKYPINPNIPTNSTNPTYPNNPINPTYPKESSNLIYPINPNNPTNSTNQIYPSPNNPISPINPLNPNNQKTTLILFPNTTPNNPANPANSNIPTYTNDPVNLDYPNNPITNYPNSSNNNSSTNNNKQYLKNLDYIYKSLQDQDNLNKEKEKIKKVLLKGIIESEKTKSLLLQYYLMRKKREIENKRKQALQNKKLSFTFNVLDNKPKSETALEQNPPIFADKKCDCSKKNLKHNLPECCKTREKENQEVYYLPERKYKEISNYKTIEVPYYVEINKNKKEETKEEKCSTENCRKKNSNVNASGVSEYGNSNNNSEEFTNKRIRSVVPVSVRSVDDISVFKRNVFERNNNGVDNNEKYQYNHNGNSYAQDSYSNNNYNNENRNLNYMSSFDNDIKQGISFNDFNNESRGNINYSNDYNSYNGYTSSNLNSNSNYSW